jgi:import inner membrane translocase subunit TIM16
MFVFLILQRYKHMFEVNEKHGSFYLVSKVYRAKECLEQVGAVSLPA